jgi:nucleotide-binding universal stress UspA family protein
MVGEQTQEDREVQIKPPMAFNSILVPLDGSPESNAALPLARTLARATSASVTLLRVLAQDDREGTATAWRTLRRIAEELADSGIGVSSAVRHGHAAQEILVEAAAHPGALVVMRTHARAGLERVILGSVADQVLERCPVPVVLMRPGERRITGIHKLLVPVDGSPGGAVALGTAVALARATGASVELVQVCVPIAMQTMVAYEYGGAGYYDPDWDDDSLAGAKTYVDGLVGRLSDQGLSAGGEAVTAPNAAQGIVGAADNNQVDLVIMSTRALTGPARTLMGSVANMVVRTAHCPVVLVHRPEVSAVGSEEAASTTDAAPTVG